MAFAYRSLAIPMLKYRFRMSIDRIHSRQEGSISHFSLDAGYRACALVSTDLMPGMIRLTLSRTRLVPADCFVVQSNINPPI